MASAEIYTTHRRHLKEKAYPRKPWRKMEEFKAVKTQRRKPIEGKLCQWCQWSLKCCRRKTISSGIAGESPRSATMGHSMVGWQQDTWFLWVAALARGSTRGATASSASALPSSGGDIWPCHCCRQVTSLTGSARAILSRDSQQAIAERGQYEHAGKGIWGRNSSPDRGWIRQYIIHLWKLRIWTH